MNRRDFMEVSAKAASLAALAKFGMFSFTPANASEEEFAWPHEQFKFQVGDLPLQKGGSLKDTFLLVDTHGTLNADKSNAIIYPTCYSGSHHLNRMSIGFDRALDPSKYCIIIPNMITSGFSTSPSNQAAPHDGPRFPEVTYYDNIEAQHRLLTSHYGINNPLLYIGFSMGGQQAFHWGVQHGANTGAIVPVAGTAKTTPHNWAFLEGLKQSMHCSADFNGGEYESPPLKGMRAFSTVYASWWYGQAGYREGLNLLWAGEPAFEQGTHYIENAAIGHFSQFDANDLMSQLNTWQIGDIGNHEKYGGDWKAVLGDIACPALLMPAETDLYFPPMDNEIEVAYMRDARVAVIPSKRGHIGATLAPGLAPEESNFADHQIKQLIARIT